MTNNRARLMNRRCGHRGYCRASLRMEEEKGWGVIAEDGTRLGLLLTTKL